MRLICSAVLLILTATAQQSPQYSRLRQINRDNVNKIELAWKYDTGDAFPGSEDQCRPLFVDGVLYLTSPKNRLLALDAADGHVLWSFDPAFGKGTNTKHRHRGLTMYASGSTRRLFYSHGPYLWAVDAKSGKPVPSFGKEGRIDLREGLGRDPRELTVGSTSPGVVWKDLLILGSIVPESLPSAPATSGRSMSIRGRFDGHFTPFRIPVSSGTRLGQRMDGSISVEQIRGRVSPSMKSAGSCLFQPDPLHSTSTARIEPETTCLQTA